MTKLTTYLKRCKEAWWRNMEQWFWTNPLNKPVRHPWCAHQFLYWVTAGGKHISNQSRFTQNQSSVNLNVLCVFIEKNIIARVQNNFSLGVSHGVGLGIKDTANYEGCHGVMGSWGHGSWGLSWVMGHGSWGLSWVMAQAPRSSPILKILYMSAFCFIFVDFQIPF